MTIVTVTGSRVVEPVDPDREIPDQKQIKHCIYLSFSPGSIDQSKNI